MHLFINTLSIIYDGMRWLLLILFLLNGSVAFGQEKLLVLPSEPIVFNGQPVMERGLDIRPYSQFFPDSVSNVNRSLSWVQNQRFYAFEAGLQYRWTYDLHRSAQRAWVRFSIQNTHPTDTLHLFVYTGFHARLILYAPHPASNATLFQGGFLTEAKNNPQGSLALPVVVPPGDTQAYYLQITDLIYAYDEMTVSLFTRSGYELWQAQQTKTGTPLFGALAVIIGCLLFMSIYTLYQFYLNRDRAFLYYALYAGTALVCVVKNTNCRFELGLLPAAYSHPYLPYLAYSFGIFYGLFLLKTLNLSIHQPRLARAIQLLIVVLVGQQVLDLIQTFSGQLFASNTYYQFRDLPNLLIGILNLVAIVRSRSPLKAYLLAGSLTLYLITFFPFYGMLRFHGLTPTMETFVYYPPFFVSVGLVIELLCFVLALAYRSRLIEVEKNRMQDHHARELEEKLTERTQQIQEQSRLLEAQHIQQLETEFEQKLADTEMVALRAQMNPHFIFNCLNSIKLYTLDNEADKASNYLTKFSRLIRLVLENSRSERVSLQNELEALQLYIELEAMRFKHKVQFGIHVSPDIDQRFVRIPPLLLQPYVENAIWHGLMHKPEGGMVTIDVTQPQENLLHIEITDDGVGRQRAVELKSKSAGKHKSFGMQVTADRIRMINQLYNTQTQAEVVDLVDSFGDPCGTRVILEIPV